MTSQDEDIFGQIDALLGKRNTAVLADKTQSGDDFPLLTDVIPNSGDSGLLDVNNISLNGDLESAALPETNNGYSSERGSAAAPGESHASSNADLIAGIENRLVELFRLQRESIEESLRNIVREELRRLDETRR